MDKIRVIEVFDRYINNVLHTWSGENEKERCLFGLFEEAGEIVGKEKKRLRGDEMQDFDTQVKKEIGDFLYYLRLYGHLHNVKIDSNIEIYYFKFTDFIEYFATDFGTYRNVKHFYQDSFINILSLIEGLGFDFEEIIKLNVDKLNSRLERGKIHGNGDER